MVGTDVGGQAAGGCHFIKKGKAWIKLMGHSGETASHPQWERHLGAIDPGESPHALRYAQTKAAQLEKIAAGLNTSPDPQSRQRAAALAPKFLFPPLVDPLGGSQQLLRRCNLNGLGARRRILRRGIGGGLLGAEWTPMGMNLPLKEKDGEWEPGGFSGVAQREAVSSSIRPETSPTKPPTLETPWTRP